MFTETPEKERKLLTGKDALLKWCQDCTQVKIKIIKYNSIILIGIF